MEISMKCLVTGANGFIGGRFVTILKEKKINPLLLLRNNNVFNENSKIICDLSSDEINPKNLKEIETVFHLASCQDAHNISLMRKVNVEGTKRLLKACEEAGVKNFIFFSSVKAMGETTKMETDETVFPEPETEYGRQKLFAEEIVLKSNIINPVIIRLPPVYGRRGKGGIINLAKLVKKSPFIPFFSNNNKRSMVFVDDLVYFAMIAANSQNISGECFILTDGNIYSTSEIVNAMLDFFDKKKRKIVIKSAVFNSYVKKFLKAFWRHGYNSLYESAYYSNKKAISKLCFHPSCTFYQAVQEICGDI